MVGQVGLKSNGSVVKMNKANPYRMPTRAIILAAGRGLRQRPHTDHTPKPLLPIDGRATLDYLLEALVNAGVRDVCVVTGHLGGKIESYLAEGGARGLRVSYRRQEKPKGTAHALSTVEAFLKEPSYVLAADYALEPDSLLKLGRAYVAAGSPLAVSLKKLAAVEMGRRSSVRFHPDGQIAEIIEKPEPGFVSSGIGASLIFILPPEIRPYLNGLALSVRGEYELQTAVNSMLSDGFKMSGLLSNAPREWQPPDDA